MIKYDLLKLKNDKDNIAKTKSCQIQEMLNLKCAKANKMLKLTFVEDKTC